MKLPVVSGNDLIKLLDREGFKVVRQKGSHVSLHKKVDDKTILVVVPMKREIKRGTLLSILKQAEISRTEFIKKIKK